ncbi:MAG: signal peptidase II [Thermodesulfobacteriota bacterium]
MTFLLTLILVVLTDQLSKWLIMESLSLYETINIIPGFFNLTYIHNPGAAFGLFAGNGEGWRLWFFVVAALIALVAIISLYRYYKNKGLLYALCLGLIGGGAVGNLIDRFRFGSVVDFLDFYIGPHHWPAFNLADSAICLGIGFFVWVGFFHNN